MKYSIIFAAVLTLACALSLCAKPPAVKKAVQSVSIDDMKFTPDKVNIKVGESVEWTNNDDRDHNVTAKDGSFKSDSISSGSSYKFTFKKAGKFPYSCTLHPRMKGTVEVAAD